MPFNCFLSRRAGKLRAILAFTTTLLVLPHLLAWTWPVAGSLRGPSASSGSSSRGSLSGGRAFLPQGRGHVTCSVLSSALGRQHAHERVVAAVTAGLNEASGRTGRRFVLGEAAWPRGGDFRPHRTHRNGLSVDLFLPFEDERGRATMPLFSPWSWSGYRFDLEEGDRLGRHRVDWSDLAEALVGIAAAAEDEGLVVERVILAPDLQPLLLAEGRRERLRGLASRLNERASWWRHDEHVHLDFRLREPTP
jgi:penicillin-insensitive murein endopeptidase